MSKENDETLFSSNEAFARRFTHGLCTLCGFTNMSKRTRLVTLVLADPTLRTEIQNVFERIWQKYRESSERSLENKRTPKHENHPI
jgi:hypothetical protein